MLRVDKTMDADEMFRRYQGERIALYGLSPETERVLQELGDSYEVVGLLDSFREEGELYGHRILPFGDAASAGVALIIVAARPGSCRAIARKIGDRCRAEGIALMDIRGRDLLEEKRASYHLARRGMSRPALEREIADADVVSFDLFDTLAVRQTLYPEDVAGYVDSRLKESGIHIAGFCQKRLESEKVASRNAAPTLEEIYRHMLEGLGREGTEDVTPEGLATLEWEIDLALLVPRREVCDVLCWAAAQGKRVYIVSDTYYSSAQLMQILEKCSVTGYAGILASSDHGTGKAQGLYGILKDMEGAERYLHIGDDIAADIEGAHRWGFDACHLPSALDLMEDVGCLGLMGYVRSLSDHLRIGMFISRMFNSPFQPEDADGQIGISDAYDIGYLLCAPMIGDFVLWFRERMEEGRFGNIWFSARDGYLIKKMYGHLLGVLGQDDRTVYFLTSRTAAIRSGISDEADIRYVDGMRFSGTLAESLKGRFGIEAADAGSEDIRSHQDGSIGYKDLILERSRRAGEGCRKYIGALGIEEGDIAFFDFVAKGTAQMFVQRLVSAHLKGFYFLQLEKEQMKGMGLDIESFCEDGGTGPCAVYEDYYFLEALLTAPHPSVDGYDPDGRPMYAAETRTDRDIRCLQRAQEGILDYFKTYIRLCPGRERTINRELDGCLLGSVHKIRITDDDFLCMMVEDPFFNRMTKITDVL